MEKGRAKIGEWYIEKKARDLAIRRAIRDSFTVVLPLSIVAGLIILYSDTSPWFMLAFLIADWFGITWVSYGTHYGYCYKIFLEEAIKEEEQWSKKGTSQPQSHQALSENPRNTKENQDKGP